MELKKDKLAVESKLIELGEVQGFVCGNWGEVSEAFHAWIAALATSRVRVGRLASQRAGGHSCSEDPEIHGHCLRLEKDWAWPLLRPRLAPY